MNISKALFGQSKKNEDIHLFTLSNDKGMTVKITNLGGTVTSILVPDKKGNIGEVTLGYDHLESYLKNPPFFGCLVGRYANRIAGAKFQLNGQEFSLAVNNGPNHLHGGPTGFHTTLWQAKTIQGSNKVSLVLSHTSPDGHEGFPGNLTCEVTYSLSNDNNLEIDYTATTDKPTIVNLTNHAYFNLKDGGETDILDHVLQINAEEYTVKNDVDIPTGAFAKVAGTPLDFRAPTSLKRNLATAGKGFEKGFDHNFVLANQSELKEVALVADHSSGRTMKVFTTCPGVQLYSAGFLNNETGRNGIIYRPFHGLCLETQHYPDSPNHPHFPTTTLLPGDQYHERTVYQFGIQ